MPMPEMISVNRVRNVGTSGEGMGLEVLTRQ
jgi:hypothetical protein